MQIRNSNPEVQMETILDRYQVQVDQTGPDGTAQQAPMTLGQWVAMAAPIGQ